MSGDDLNSYKLQMQQVDAALTSDPNNPELLTLKADLQQVIDLTEELITEQQTKSESDIPTEGSEEILPESSTSSSSSLFERKSRPHDHLNPIKHWQVGEQCQAVWEKDGK